MAKHLKKNKIENVTIIVLLIIFIFSTALVIKNKVKEYKDNKEIEKISNVLENIETEEKTEEQEKTERSYKVEKLKSESPEVVGWLEIEGTNINYPVCQSQDNDYYLTHTYKKEKNSNGSLFLDKDYKFGETNNILIYGHRNKKGLMFDELIKYESFQFYKEHNQIRFTTDTTDDSYKIISVFKSRVYYQDENNVFRYYNYVDIKNQIDYTKFVEKCKKISLYETDTTAQYGEQLMTLSTCDYSQKNGRFVVVAKKVNI